MLPAFNANFHPAFPKSGDLNSKFSAIQQASKSAGHSLHVVELKDGVSLSPDSKRQYDNALSDISDLHKKSHNWLAIDNQPEDQNPKLNHVTCHDEDRTLESVHDENGNLASYSCFVANNKQGFRLWQEDEQHVFYQHGYHFASEGILFDKSANTGYYWREIDNSVRC